MSKYEALKWGTVSYHLIAVLVALGVAWFICRKKQVSKNSDKAALLVNGIVFVESINLIWYMKYADEIYGIRDQGIEVGRMHLWVVGALFAGGLAAGIGAERVRGICVCMGLSYIFFGLIAIVVA